MIFPLRLKLALFTSAFLAIGIAIVSMLILQVSRGALQAEALKRGESLASNLARNARQPVLLQDDVVIAKLLETVSSEAEVIAARVLDPEGRPIASVRDSNAPPHERLSRKGHPASKIVGGRLIVASSMSFHDVDLGEVQIVMDLDGILTPVVDRARAQLLLISGGLLAIGVGIAFAASSSLTRPLTRLQRAVRALSAGDRSARVPATSRDEVGELTRAFNDMAESLAQKERVESAFRRYVSDYVLREVLDNPESISLSGESRHVSVLFVDIRKFSPLAERIGPERVVEFLNETFGLITNRLLDHGGTVDKYMGDAILAYFGAPIEAADHPQRSVAAAIAIQRSVRERNQKCEARGLPFVPLDVGIGICSGPVVVGNIGSELKMDYTAIGDPVNLSNRLQKLAEPGWILITDEVAEAVRDFVELEPLGPQEIEGKARPLRVHRVLY
ncbi:MAG: adenylate/guanylate cyclase domain-containing protein [Myxococcota bacterium]